MAITEKSRPNPYTSAHEDVFYVISSDNVAQPNFKYVFDVYIDTSLVARLKIFPEPNFNLGICNVGEIVRSYFRNNNFRGQPPDIFDNSSVPNDGRFTKDITIQYGEEYGIPTTTYTNLENASGVTVYNYYNDLLYKNIAESLSIYKNNFLSSGSVFKNITLDETFFVYYWNEALVNTSGTVRKYDAAGALLGTLLITMTTLNAELVCLSPYPIAIGSSFINSSVAYYTYTVNNGTISRMMTFTLDCFPKYAKYNIIFFNQFGGFDTAQFRMKSSRKIDMERKAFGRTDFRYENTGFILYYDAHNKILRGDSMTYATKFNHKFHLNTDILNDAEFLWLQQLVASPLVYLELYKGTTPYYFPVKILADSYDIKTNRNGSVSNFGMDVQVLQELNTQFS